MSSKYLNDSGLAYFWTKIKAYIAGLLGSKADDADVVHKAGDENVTGTKTFVGSKKIAFKQSAANDKLGFTLYNNSNVEKGYLEYNPTNQISGVPLMTLGNYATAAAGRAYVGFRKYSSISGANGAYNLLAPLISDAKAPFNLTTTYTNFFLTLGVTDGTTTVVTDKSGLLDIGALIPSTFASDAVTAMTGYSKPGSGGAIAAGDSLNAAIGKLEFKVDSVDDSNYVHLTGNETVTGTKTFSNTISGSIDGNAATATDAFRLTSSTPDSTWQKVVFTGGQLEIGTSAGNVYVGSSNNVQLISAPEGGTVFTQTIANVQNLRFVWNGDYFSDIFVSPNNRYVWHRDVTGGIALPWRRLVEENAAGITAPNWNISIAGNAATASAVAWSGVTGKPTTITGYGITDAKIVNGTITLGSNSITPLTSHQDISGKVNKTGDTMTGDLRVPSLYFDYSLYKKHPNVVKGTNPSEIKFWSLANCDKNGIDYANNMLGVVETSLSAGGLVSTYMRAIKNQAGSQANGTLGVAYDTANNYAYTFAPTPTATTDNTNKIATTEWVRRATGNTALNAASANTIAFAQVALTKGTPPSETNWLTSWLKDDAAGVAYENRIVELRSFVEAGGRTGNELVAYDFASGATGIAILGVYYEMGGVSYAVCPTPAAGDSSNKIATTEWVRALGYLPASGGRMTGELKISASSANQLRLIAGNYGVIFRNDGSSFYLLQTDSGQAENGTWNNARPLSLDLSSGLCDINGRAKGLSSKANLGEAYQMNSASFTGASFGGFRVGTFKAGTSSVPYSGDAGDYSLFRFYEGADHFSQFLMASPRDQFLWYGRFWDGTFNRWIRIFSDNAHIRLVEGNTIYRSRDDDSLYLAGGTGIGVSAHLKLNGKNYTGGTGGAFNLIACTSSSDMKNLHGAPNGTLQWNGQNIQTTSDQRLKTKLESVPDDVLDAWEGVEWGQFRYLEAVAEKGGTARLHSGLVSQQVQKAFSDRGLDACAYGLICHETRDAVDVDDVVETRSAYTDEEGVFHPEEKITEHRHEDAVDLWMIRYAEALCMEAACQRRENARLKKRVADLEERLAALELKIS